MRSPLLLLPILSGVMWGTSGIFVRDLSDHGLDNFTIVFAREILAAVMVLSVILLTDRDMLRIRKRDAWVFVVCGLSMVGINVFYTVSVDRVSLSLAAVLLGLSPVFMLIMARVIFKERITRRKLVCMFASIVGCVLLSGVLESGDSLGTQLTRGEAAQLLCASLEQGLAVLTADDAGDSCGVLPLLKKASSLLETAAGVDPAFAAQTSRLENAFYEIEDAAAELERRLHTEVFDPQRLEAVEERLSLLYRLKKKYGPSLEDVMAYGETAARELETLANWDENRSALDGEISALEKELLAAGNRISEKRAAASAGMAHAVEDILRTLGMAGTRFQVSLQPKGAEGGVRTASQYGFDDIEFRISANPGEPLRPLAKIASGGEISRVMLALKTVLSGADKTGTLIFDEIDTGIGGEVAVAVGTHIRNLSRSRQILCITHLASIACQADNHIVIEKESSGGETRTSAREIREQDREEEISRMLSGGKGGEVSLHHARELLEKYSGGRHA